jgi:hypothetical protein
MEHNKNDVKSYFAWNEKVLRDHLPVRVLPHRKGDEEESSQLSPSASSPGEYPQGGVADLGAV